MSTALLKVCLVLGAFSALNFVATAGADRQYRSTFVDPALREVHEGLQVRRAYLAARAQAAQAAQAAEAAPEPDPTS